MRAFSLALLSTCAVLAPTMVLWAVNGGSRGAGRTLRKELRGARQDARRRMKQQVTLGALPASAMFPV